MGKIISPEGSATDDMKRRIAIWASAGFVIVCCWVLYTFITPPEQFIMIMKEPFGEVIVFMTLPIAFAYRSLPLPFWAVPPINAATYALLVLIVGMLRRKSHPGLAI